MHHSTMHAWATPIVRQMAVISMGQGDQGATPALVQLHMLRTTLGGTLA